MSRKVSSNEHFTKPQSSLELDTFPDFMKSPNPQVKFHSAFPPFTTKVRVRGVMERAGFDVYKPEKERSVSLKSPIINDQSNDKNDISQFHPPNKFHSNRSISNSLPSPKKLNNQRSSSHNKTVTSLPTSRVDSHNSIISSNKIGNNNNDNNSLKFQNPSHKTRNFTAIPSISTSTPDLLSSPSGHFNNSPTNSIDSPTSKSKKKNSILSYARNKLSLRHSKDTKDSQDLQNNFNTNYNNNNDNDNHDNDNNINHDVDNNDLLLPDISLNPNINNSNKESIESQQIDGLDIHYPDDYSNTKLYDENNEIVYERKIPAINGPRPFVDTEGNDPLMSNKIDNYDPFDSQSEVKLSSTNNPKNLEILEHQDIENDQEYSISNMNNNLDPVIPNIEVDNQSITDNSINEVPNQLDIPQTNAILKSPSRSSVSSSSVESFDEKFMLQQKENNNLLNASQDTLGGLNGLRQTINSNEIDSTEIPLIPNVSISNNSKNNPYNKRISTLSTNDTKIYNLESLDNDEIVNTDKNDYNYNSNDQLVNQMTIIHEDNSENSNRTSQNDQITSIIPNVQIASDDVQAEVPVVILNENDSSIGKRESLIFQDAQENNYNSNYFSGNVDTSNQYDKYVEEDQLLRRGFTKRKANTIETPKSSNEPSIPNIETVKPQLPNTINGISDLINDIDNFQNNGDTSEISEEFNSNTNEISQSFEIPPRHFEKAQELTPTTEIRSSLEIENEIENESHIHDHVDSHNSHNSHSHNHPYASLSHSSYSPSVGSAPLRMSSGFTTPDKESHYEKNNIDLNIENTKKTLYYPPGEGPCRKCGDIILESEKKIWSKDNQLSGQWHRSCFGCNKCNAKFNKGSSCYVHGDQPYCERHFHELNGSLCKVCNKGVEGECLQNEVNEVFHIDCLKCVICGLNVTGDYFIFRGEVMCEDDAKELMYQIEQAEKEYKNSDIDKIIKRRTRVLYL